MYEFFIKEFRVSFLFLCIIKVSTARASPVVVLVGFLSLPLGLAASVLEAYPVVDLVADLTNVYIRH